METGEWVDTTAMEAQLLEQVESRLEMLESRFSTSKARSIEIPQPQTQREK